jgi:hypothetical protein
MCEASSGFKKKQWRLDVDEIHIQTPLLLFKT